MLEQDIKTRVVSLDAALKLAGTLILAVLVPLVGWMMFRLLDHSDRLSRIEVRQHHADNLMMEQKTLLREMSSIVIGIDRKVSELAARSK